MSRSEIEHAVSPIRCISEGRTLIIIELDMGVVFDLADRISVLVTGNHCHRPAAKQSRQTQKYNKPIWGRRSMMLESKIFMPFTGRVYILQGVTLNVADGEILSILAATASAARRRSR